MHIPASGTIWIADDSRPILRLLGFHAERAGHQVATFQTAGDLLRAACDDQTPDLILLDREFGPHDGVRIGTALRAVGYQRSLILCTARVDDPTRELCKADFDGLVQKPIEPDLLDHLIGAALRSEMSAHFRSA